MNRTLELARDLSQVLAQLDYLIVGQVCHGARAEAGRHVLVGGVRVAAALDELGCEAGAPGQHHLAVWGAVGLLGGRLRLGRCSCPGALVAGLGSALARHVGGDLPVVVLPAKPERGAH